MMDLVTSSKFPANRCVFHYIYSDGISIVTLPFSLKQVTFGDPLDAVYDNYSIIGTTVEILPEEPPQLEPILDNPPYWETL
jgi:hypothetical protein